VATTSDSDKRRRQRHRDQRRDPSGDRYCPDGDDGRPSTGTAQEGQTLTASAATTNDVDAVVHYQWEKSTNGFATFTTIGSDSLSYAVTEADEGPPPSAWWRPPRIATTAPVRPRRVPRPWR